MEERLQKVLAAAGVASRRGSEQLIAAGRVAVDGRVVTEMGVKVDPEQQRITVDGRPIAVAPRKVYVLLNKPKGFVTTRSDPHATRTVMDLIAEVPVPVYPVGRLDKDTEGALILTNDGELAHRLTHPRHGVPRVYEARVKGVPDEKALERLRTGVRLEDGMTAPARLRILGVQGGNAALEVVLWEGRNRQVRRMLSSVGHPVEHLRRVAIGPVSIRKLPVGGWRYLSQRELHALRRATEGAGVAPAPEGRQQGAPGRGSRADRPSTTDQSRGASGAAADREGPPPGPSGGRPGDPSSGRRSAQPQRGGREQGAAGPKRGLRPPTGEKR